MENEVFSVGGIMWRCIS